MVPRRKLLGLAPDTEASSSPLSPGRLMFAVLLAPSIIDSRSATFVSSAASGDARSSRARIDRIAPGWSSCDLAGWLLCTVAMA